VVYRDRSGHLGLIDKYCVHRRASMAYAVVEKDGIRCQYHGWKYDSTGTCIDQPFEEMTHAEANFKDRCPINAYPVQERAGLIFAYMGPTPAPLLPNWGPLVWDNAVRDIAITHLPCNWLQAQENSLDSTHTEHLHDYAARYFRQIMTGEEPDFKRGRTHTKIGFEPYKYGIIKRRTTDDRGEDHPRWTRGHSILFPNILWHNATMQFRVPADDTHTMHFSLYIWRAAPGHEAPTQEVVPSRNIQLMDEMGQFAGLNYLFNQDYMCWATQGPIADRELEKLGESDRGVIMFRKMLSDQLDIMAQGDDPTINIFRSDEENSGLEWPAVPHESGEYVGAYFGRGEPKYHPSESGYSRDAEKIEAVMKTWQEYELPAGAYAGE
jgi:5,5'-dehydrodivanillate O-demethylase